MLVDPKHARPIFFDPIAFDLADYRAFWDKCPCKQARSIYRAGTGSNHGLFGPPWMLLWREYAGDATVLGKAYHRGGQAG